MKVLDNHDFAPYKVMLLKDNRHFENIPFTNKDRYWLRVVKRVDGEWHNKKGKTFKTEGAARVAYKKELDRYRLLTGKT